MHEVATILMRSTPGWTEYQTSDATFLFQFRNATMTIFPNGNWHCEMTKGVTKTFSKGTVNNLDKFLKDFAVINPL